MADQKISALVGVAAASPNDQFGINQSSSSRRLSVSTLFTQPAFPSYFELNAVGTPSAPATSTLRMYSKNVAGRILPEYIAEAGHDTNIQPAIFNNQITFWTPSNIAAGNWRNASSVGAAVGAFTLPSMTTTNVYTSMRRGLYTNSSATASTTQGQRNVEQLWWRGSGTEQGGFFYFARFGFDTWANGSRLFAGFCSSNQVVIANPSTISNTIGFAVDSADNGAVFFQTTGIGTTTRTATGMTMSTNAACDAYIFAKANDSVIYYRLDNINTQSTMINGSTNTTLVSSSTFMMCGVLAGNGTNLSTSSNRLGINKIYVETDY